MSLSPPKTGRTPRLILLCLAIAELCWTGFAWTHPPVPVLVFHDIAAKPGPADFWTISPPVFREILDTVSNLGLRTLGDDELFDRLHSWRGYSPSILLTFDDGLLSQRDIVAPELLRRGMRGVFFLVTHRMGSGGRIGAGDASRMAAAGFRLGSHSATHGSLVRAPDETEPRFTNRLVREIASSQGEVGLLAGGTALSFAYPGGETGGEAREMVRAAGYGLAFTTDLGYATAWDDPLLLPRNLLFSNVTAAGVASYCTEPLRWLRWRLCLDNAAILLLLASFAFTAPRRLTQSGA